jgi:uncharacterized protein YegL
MPKKKSVVDPNKPKAKRGRPPKAKKYTRVALVIDRSASMGTVRDAAYSGINEQIKTLKRNAKKGGETTVSYIQFDDIIETLWENRPAKDLKEIEYNDYVPRNSTALRDAMGKAIRCLQSSGPETADTGYLVIVISDGYENASKEWSRAALRGEMDRLTATGKWTFTMLMSNVDIKKITEEYGVYTGNITTFVHTTVGVSNAFQMSSNSSARYLSERAVGITSTPTFYTPPTPATTEDDLNINIIPTPKTP